MLSSNRPVSAFKSWRTARLIFRAGSKVEVWFEEDNLRDVWFPATIVEELGNDLCLVEYECLGANDEAELRRVTINHLHIRPSSPQIRDTNFVLLEKVDAFYDFGWWSGVITKKLADSRYVVYFKHTNKVRELSHLELRPHVEWKGDTWFTPYQVPVSNVDSVVGNGESSSVKCSTEETTTVFLNSTDPIEDTTSGIDKQISIVTSMKRTKLTNPGGNDKQLKSSKKLKAGITSDDPSLSDVGQSKEVSNPPVGASGDHNTEEATTGDKASGKTENLSRRKKMNGKGGKGVVMNHPTVNSTRKKGRLSRNFRGNEALTQGATGNSVKRTTPDIVEKEHVTKDLPSIVIGLQSNVLASSQGKKPKQLPIEKSLNIAETKTPELGVPLTPKLTGNADAGTISKRKRGRPPKLQAKSPDTPLAGAVAPAGTESGKENQELQFPGSSNDPKQKKTSESSVDTPVVHVEKPPDRSSGKVLSVQQEKYKQPVKGKRGKRRTISSINIESSTQDCQDPSKQKANGGFEKDSTAGSSRVYVEKSLDTMSEDQPLSRWFEGMHTSATVDRTAGNKKDMENARDPVAVAAEPDGMNGEKLSIEKRSSLWQTLESMELFRMVPQKPHFRPLEGTKESLREGQAISKMVTFVSVVENTCRLRFESPRSSIEEYLEMLVDLESHGFDVKLIRNRLTDLLLVKDEQEELEGRSKEVRDKMEEESVEGEKMVKEMELLDEQVQVLMRKRKQMVSKKEKKDSEIAVLEAEVKEIKEGMVKAQEKFDSIAAASLCEQQQP